MLDWTFDSNSITSFGSIEFDHLHQLDSENLFNLKETISQQIVLDPEEFYLTWNGRILTNTSLAQIPMKTTIPIRIIPKLLGGKGGFGSMLRAIGAQIEKTTNRDACRDLSGRRLRDINEEQRLKKWFEKQKEREAESIERKKKKLDKLRQICDGPPLPKMEDKEYNDQRANMAESVYEAVEKGLEAVASSSSTAALEESKGSDSDSNNSEKKESTSSSETESKDNTNKSIPSTSGSSEPGKSTTKITVKKTMWDEDLDSDVSSSSEDEDEIPKKKAKVN